MKKIIQLLLLLQFSLAASAQNQPGLNLMPVPKSITPGSGRFALNSAFGISVTANAADTTLYAAVNRSLQTLNRRTQLYFAQQRITAKDKADTSVMQIIVKTKAGVALGQDESYDLTITAGKVKLESANTTGALHGLETFLQLVQHDDAGFYLPEVTIHDSPRFAWRGLMIDVARHFIPLDVLQRNIDAMATVKMNVLHLHLSDDEGFRIESKLYPLLTKNGSYGEFYTQAEMKGLIAYAKQRGIIIMPEFDMPGHTTGFLAGYPALSADPGKTYQPGPRFNMSGKKGLADIMKMISSYPTPSFDPSKEATYQFLDKFLGEMAALFPSPYIHIGADENNGAAWKANPAIVAFMKKNKIADTHALQAYFVKRVQALVTKHHKKTIGWEELLSKDLPKDVAVQVWQDPNKAKDAAALGHPVIISNGFYLDLFLPAYVHYNNPLFSDASLEGKIWGGEGAQWAEAMNAENAENRMWPRAAVVAERLWSPATVNDVDDMYRRLAVVNNRLDEAGLQHISSYQRALRRLAGSNDITALKTLMDALEPIKGYKKMFAKMGQPRSASYQTAPLTTPSDIIPVDPEDKRPFRAAVKKYLAKPDEATQKWLTQKLESWKAQYTSLRQAPNSGLVPTNLYAHSKNLADAAEIGLQALKLLAANEQPSAEWLKAATTRLQEAKGVYGEMDISVIPEIEALVTKKLVAEPVSYPMF